MPIESAEFDRRLEKGELPITLVGMSNVGKTHWSKRLTAEAGFVHLCCDDLIEEELGDELEELGYSGIEDMSKWLGQPYDPQFAKNQQRYLELETSIMRQIIDDLENDRLDGNTLIDTTGSVVHTDPEIRRRLGELTTVVHLEATPEMREEMFELYIARPKPVVWADVYQPIDSEAPQEALARCYPQLLSHRIGLYDEMSHVTIPRETSLAIAGPEDFLGHVRDSLPG